MDLKKCAFSMGRGGRRSKNDPHGRVFKCGCGKSYLSYPALYTHVKTRHDGIQPEGTIAPAANKDHVRGRPSKALSSQDLTTVSTEEEQVLIDHCRYGGPSDPLSSFDSTVEGLGYEINQLMKHDEGMDQIKMPDDEMMQTVLAHYLVEVAQLVDEEVYLKTAHIITQLRLTELSDIERVYRELSDPEPRLKWLVLKHLINWMYKHGYFNRFVV